MPIVQHWIKAPNINHQLLFSMRVGGGGLYKCETKY